MFNWITKVKTNLKFRILLARTINAILVLLALFAVGLDHLFWMTPLILVIPSLVLFESVLLTLLGTTPGNILCGIEIVAKDEVEKLNFFQALTSALFFKRSETYARFREKDRSYKRALSLVLVFTATSLYFTVFDYSLISLWKDHAKPKQEISWVELKSDRGGFNISFPVDPVLQTRHYPVPDSSRVLTLDEYKATINNNSYCVSYLDVPSVWKIVGVKKILKSALDLFAEQLKAAQVTSKEYSHFHQYRSMNFSVNQGDKKISGLIFMKGNRVFLLSYTAPVSSEVAVEYNQFLDSFTLTN